MSTIKIGILGAGSFARAITPLFKAHPQVAGLSLCERLPERPAEEAKVAGITETYEEFDDLLVQEAPGEPHWELPEPSHVGAKWWENL